MSQGILSQELFEAKLEALKTAVANEVRSAEKTAAKEAQVTKLQAAKNAGVLTQAEFDQKVSALR